MRTNVEIDDDVLEKAMRAGPYKTKREAVDAGLKLLARQAAYREVLRYKGKLHWSEDAPDEATVAPSGARLKRRRA